MFPDKQDQMEKDYCQKDNSSEINLQIPSSSVSLQIEPLKQNKQNFPVQQILLNYALKCFIGGLFGAITVKTFKIRSKYWPILGTCIFYTPKMFDYLKKICQNCKQSSLNISDCERLIGLEEFKKINGRDYTKDEFNQKLNRCFQFEDPNKQPTEALKQNALKRQRNLQLAKFIIYKKNGWEE
ncbi:hypothetical protein ABPG72_016291 [Tetrahymena utriculariae]